jgi:hypothetical protein
MASISLHLDGEVDIDNRVHVEGDCLSMWLTSYVGEDLSHVYQRDAVYLHGSSAQIRSFAQKILAVVPEPAGEPATEPAPELTEA